MFSKRRKNVLLEQVLLLSDYYQRILHGGVMSGWQNHNTLSHVRKINEKILFVAATSGL